MTSILTNIESCLSCNLPEIVAITDQEQADIEVRLYMEQDGLVYATSLLPYNREVKIYGLADMIEEDMTARGLTEAKYQIWVNEESKIIDVLFCNRSIAVIDANGDFLTSRKRAMANVEEVVYLSSKLCEDEVKAKVIFEDQEFYSVELEGGFTFLVDNTRRIYINAYIEQAAELSGRSGKPKALSFTCGKRQCTFYLTDVLPDINIIFRNCFNALESMSIKAKITAKEEVTSSVSVTGGKKKSYDITSDVVYEVETSHLSQEEAESLSQAMASPFCVISCNAGSGEAVLSDIDLSVDNNDEQYRTAKFKFEFIERRPRLTAMSLADMIDLGCPNSPFSRQFTREFL